METYIRKCIEGYFAKFPEEIDSVYWQGQIGVTYEDFEKNMWIHLSEDQISFYNEHPYATIKEIISMSIEPETLQEAIDKKLQEIETYDSSDIINSFIVNINNTTFKYWFTSEERSNYKNSIDSAEILSIENIHLIVNGILLTIPTQTAKLYLAQIQLYADNCWNTTELHKTTVKNLKIIEDVKNYNFKENYPEHLVFNL